jgi:hypothetical protein
MSDAVSDAQELFASLVAIVLAVHNYLVSTDVIDIESTTSDALAISVVTMICLSTLIALGVLAVSILRSDEVWTKRNAIAAYESHEGRGDSARGAHIVKGIHGSAGVEFGRPAVAPILLAHSSISSSAAGYGKDDKDDTRADGTRAGDRRRSVVGENASEHSSTTDSEPALFRMGRRASVAVLGAFGLGGTPGEPPRKASETEQKDSFESNGGRHAGSSLTSDSQQRDSIDQDSSVVDRTITNRASASNPARRPDPETTGGVAVTSSSDGSDDGDRSTIMALGRRASIAFLSAVGFVNDDGKATKTERK